MTGTVTKNVVQHPDFFTSVPQKDVGEHKTKAGSKVVKNAAYDYAVIVFHQKEPVFSSKYVQPLKLCPDSFRPKALRVVGMGNTLPLDMKNKDKTKKQFPYFLQEDLIKENQQPTCNQGDTFPVDLKTQFCLQLYSKKGLLDGVQKGDSGSSITLRLFHLFQTFFHVFHLGSIFPENQTQEQK